MRQMKKVIGWLLMIVGWSLIIWAAAEVFVALTAHAANIDKEPDPKIRELPKIIAGGIAVVIGYLLKK